MNGLYEVFEERIVLFVDILGFSELVARASLPDGGEFAKKIQRSLNVTENMKLYNSDKHQSKRMKLTEEVLRSINVVVFSDSIVVTIETEKEQFESLMKLICSRYLLMLSMGVLIRGGVTIGKISKDKNTPWGPAFNEAYKTEISLAQFPRVVFAKKLVKHMRTNGWLPEFEQLCSRDDDGVYSLTPIKWATEKGIADENVLTPSMALNIKSFLDTEYERIVDNPAVFKKIKWICSKWDKYVDPKKVGEDTEYRTEHGKYDLVDIFTNALDF